MIVCWFSCGAASACATKLAIEKYGKDDQPVYITREIKTKPCKTEQKGVKNG